MKQLNLIQAPISLGQSLKGVEQAPAILLQNGLQETIESLGWSIHSNKIIKQPDDAGALNQAYANISKITSQSVLNQQFSLTLGGDHSVAIGSIGGALLAKPNLGVIWVDAHGDFNTPEISPSGHLHGMPLSFLTGQVTTHSPFQFNFLKNFLFPSQLVLVGIRSLDSQEKILMKKWGAHVYTMTEVDQMGIGAVMEEAKKILFKSGSCPLYLSYDIDAVDPHFAPSTGTRVRGGLNYREAHYIAEWAAATQQLVGMDLVEINPTLGTDQNLTTELGIELIASALGKRIY